MLSQTKRIQRELGRRHLRQKHRRPASRWAPERLEDRLMLDGTALGDDDVLVSDPQLSQFESAEVLEQYLIDDAKTRFEHLFGEPGWQYPWFYRGGDVLFAVALEDSGTPTNSETNTQVAGVDEGDIVETDGDYLYVLAGNELVIIDSWPAEQLEVESRYEFQSQPFAQYLNGDRLTVLSYGNQIWGPIGGISIGGPLLLADAWFPYPFEPSVEITILDVSDRSNPTLVQETSIDGSYVDSRAIGDSLYMVTRASFGLPTPELICKSDDDPVDPQPDDPQPDDPQPDDPTDTDPDARMVEDVRIIDPPVYETNCRYETEVQYFERIEDQILSLGLPGFTAQDADGNSTSGLISAPTDIYRPLSKNDSSLISIQVFDTASDELGPTGSVSVPTSYVTEVYASAQSMYLINPQWGWWSSEQHATSIFKFDFIDSGRDIELSAIGKVSGQTLNQFSIDEYNGSLRIATTIGWGTESVNSIFVLQQFGTSLRTVGSIRGLAPGERIYSARFIGDQGFVVTFRQVDPLFALDLSDPTDPRVVGELKIPGFSNYLQSIDAGHLIGLGRNADPVTGRVQELQLSLFDVTDLTDPQLADRFSIDLEGWTWSEATTDHHAIGFYPDYNVLAFPVTNGSGWVWIDRDSDGVNDLYTYRPTTDLWVFQIDIDDSAAGRRDHIVPLGRITHDGTIRRNVRIGPYLYSISDSTIKVHEMLDPSSLVAELHFGQQTAGVPVYESDRDNPMVALAISRPQATAPQVADIRLSGSGWSRQFVDHLESDVADNDLQSVSWSGVDQIKVVFSEDVAVGQNDLSLTGLTPDGYNIRAFTYDAATSTATWTLAQPLTFDTVQVEISDLVQDMAGNRLDGNSDGNSGGRFNTSFQSTPGDVTQDGRIDRSDLFGRIGAMFSSLGDPNYDMTADVNGDGIVNLIDLVTIRRQGLALTAQQAGPAAAAPAAVISRAAATDAAIVRLSAHRRQLTSDRAEAARTSSRRVSQGSIGPLDGANSADTLLRRSDARHELRLLRVHRAARRALSHQTDSLDRSESNSAGTW